MPENTPQAQKYVCVACAQRIAVIGGSAATPSSGVVLGGLDGVKSGLANASTEVRIRTVLDAENYGEAGLNLAISALKDEDFEVIGAAYV